MPYLAMRISIIALTLVSPRRATPRLALPCLTLPGLAHFYDCTYPCHAPPCLAKPDLAEPFRALPSLAWPCHIILYLQHQIDHTEAANRTGRLLRQPVAPIE